MSIDEGLDKDDVAIQLLIVEGRRDESTRRHRYTSVELCLTSIVSDVYVVRTSSQRCPWIGFIHGLDWVGLDWIGSDDCYVQNFDGLCFSAKQTKTILCNN